MKLTSHNHATSKAAQVTPNKNKLTFILLAFLVLTFTVVLGSLGYQAYTEKQTIHAAQESVLRQDRQHLQEETQAAKQASMSNDSASNTANAAASTQSFSGTLRLSSYQERAAEVGANANMFPNAPIMLLVLDTPTSATGYSVGDDAPSIREISVIRVPDSIGENGKKISIEIQDPVYFPSDVSGLIWDLDLLELESLKAEPRQ